MWIAVGFYLVCSVFGLLLMKQGLSNTSASVSGEAPFLTISSQLDLRTVIGITLYVLSFFTWLYLLKRFHLSYIFPVITGLSYLGVLAVSYFVLAERFNVPKLVGIFLILAGVLLVFRNDI